MTPLRRQVLKIDRSIEPALGAAPTINQPQIWTADLSNGLKVYGIENNELPLVTFSLRIKGGMLMDDPEKSRRGKLNDGYHEGRKPPIRHQRS